MYVPRKQHLDHTAVAPLVRTRDTQVETWRTWHGTHWDGPVLAAWPGAKELAAADEASGVTALCVLLWNRREVDAWRLATGAEILGAVDSEAASSLPYLDPVVRVALRHLVTMVGDSRSLSGAFDRDLAVDTLLHLHDAGYRLDPDGLYVHALALGCRAGAADDLKTYAARIDGGTRMRCRNRPLRRDSVAGWRIEAEDV